MPTSFSILALAVVLVVAIDVVLSTRRRQSFNRRFPPISDAEFLARCDPGTNLHVALRVRRIVAEQLGIEYERVHPSARLFEDLGAD